MSDLSRPYWSFGWHVWQPPVVASRRARSASRCEKQWGISVRSVSLAGEYSRVSASVVLRWCVGVSARPVERCRGVRVDPSSLSLEGLKYSTIISQRHVTVHTAASLPDWQTAECSQSIIAEVDQKMNVYGYNSLLFCCLSKQVLQNLPYKCKILGNLY